MVMDMWDSGMVNGRGITGQLSVRLPRPEIRRTVIAGQLEIQLGPNLIRFADRSDMISEPMYIHKLRLKIVVRLLDP
jgi:hypothetical protein